MALSVTDENKLICIALGFLLNTRTLLFYVHYNYYSDISKGLFASLVWRVICRYYTFKLNLIFACGMR